MDQPDKMTEPLIDLFSSKTYYDYQSTILKNQKNNSIYWDDCYNAWIFLKYKNIKEVLKESNHFTVDEGYHLDTFKRAEQDRSIGLAEGRPNYPNNIESRRETHFLIKKTLSSNLDDWIESTLVELFSYIKNKSISIEKKLIYPYIVKTNLYPINVDDEIIKEIQSIIINHSKSFLVSEKKKSYIEIYNVIKKLNIADTGFNKKFYIDLFFSGSGATNSLIKECFLNFKYLTSDNIDSYIQECLRFTTQMGVVYRTCKKDYHIDGIKIKKGDRIILHIGAGNFDTERFGNNSLDFNLNRDFDKLNLAFGYGPHQCVGYQHTQKIVKSLLMFIINNNINFNIEKTLYLTNLNNRLHPLDDINVFFYS